MTEPKSVNEVLAIMERAHKMSISGPDVPEDATTYGLAAKTIRDLQARLEMAMPIVRELETHSGRYTRAFGQESNAERVLDLTTQDVYSLGQRLRAVITTGKDPGDSRFICSTLSCKLPKSHSGEHDLAGADRG